MEQTQLLTRMLATVIVLGIGGQWLAWRLRVPAILLLLILGCLAGSVTGLIDPDLLFGDLLQPIVSLSVGLILFEGGLNLKFRELRGTWKSLLGLLTVGVLITWVGGTIAAWGILQTPLPVALVLGAVLTVTGPTVIGPLLREIRPAGNVGVIARWEGITIDPVGATLAVLVFEAVTAYRVDEFGSATINAIRGFAFTGISGLLVGLAAAWTLTESFRRFWVPDYLQNPMTMLYVVAAFAGAELLHHEAGLLAVTVMGMGLANQKRIDIHRILEFKESLTILLIATLFILIAARIPLPQLTQSGWRGPAFAAAMILIVRPVSVWLSTIGSGLTSRERGFLAWFAPRGIVAAAVSSVFAMRMGDAGAIIAPATLIVVFTTVTVYGLTAARLARRLGLSTANPQGLLIAGANQTARAVAAAISREGFRVVLVDSRYQRIAKARKENLEACFASILSEYVMDAVSFGGLGRFLAMTSNDQINTMAAARFREIFGRQNVYQLPRTGTGATRLEVSWQDRLAGRPLFGPRLTYDFLDSALDHGGLIKTTRFTEVFTLESYRTLYGERALPLFLIDASSLQVLTEDTKLSPRKGQTLISLILPESAAGAAPPLITSTTTLAAATATVTAGAAQPTTKPATGPNQTEVAAEP